MFYGQNKHNNQRLNMIKTLYQQFSLPLLQWFDQYGRKDFPWQHPRSPYRVWVSEIMLQQTQVKTVIPYFNRFMTTFSDISALATASEDEVLAHWSGLGYYSRGRNLHKTAKIIHNDYEGRFPTDLHQLIKLPGIGPSTAAAIASLAFGQQTAILDGNVKRVLSRYFQVDGLINHSVVHKKLGELANACMPNHRCADYTQAIMDLGATCCTRSKPNCLGCPLQTTCLAKKNDQILNYPNKAVKKIRPTQHQTFLLLHREDNVIYLEKRPPTGIWGGLWCLPAIDTATCPLTHVIDRYGIKTELPKDLLTIKHSFSHFHLRINALSLQTLGTTPLLAETCGRWFSQAELTSLGLAKPIDMILKHFFCHTD